MNVAQSLAGNIIDYLSFAFSSKKQTNKKNTLIWINISHKNLRGLSQCQVVYNVW
jgi:hypothetical protein